MTYLLTSDCGAAVIFSDLVDVINVLTNFKCCFKELEFIVRRCQKFMSQVIQMYFYV